jgi:hypothetical protein
METNTVFMGLSPKVSILTGIYSSVNEMNAQTESKAIQFVKLCDFFRNQPVSAAGTSQTAID